MPAGFRTLDGPHRDWAREFGLVQHTSPLYPPRTAQNVRDAMMTVRVAIDFDSAGERCTARAIARYMRASADIRVRLCPSHALGMVCDKSEVVAAAAEAKRLSRALGAPIVVNFAGNSESAAPGIERFAFAVVRCFLQECES